MFFQVTSFAIHIMPGLFHYLLRWDSRMWNGLEVKFTSLTWSEQFFYPLCFYLTWQLVYFYIQFTYIEKDKTLVTSLRHLARDHKNPSTILGYKLATYLGKFENTFEFSRQNWSCCCFKMTRKQIQFSGFIKAGEEMDPYKLNIIMMFASFQLVYVVLSLIPTRLMYNYELVNALYLVTLTFCAIWNGGSYYIQIFSQRYNEKFEKTSNEKKE